MTCSRIKPQSPAALDETRGVILPVNDAERTIRIGLTQRPDSLTCRGYLL